MSADSASDYHSHHSEFHSHYSEITRDADGRWLGIALALIAGFMVAEIVVSLVAHSLALLSDAVHMLTDVGALGLAVVALRISKRPAGGRYTYGFRRVEILSAQANGLTLLILAVLLAIEAVRRLVTPPAVTGSLVLVTALFGVAINLLATQFLRRANRTSLNVEGAFQHVLTDLFGFAFTAAAGIVILTAHWQRADAVASLLVVMLLMRAGVGLVRDSGRIFMEAAPENIDPTLLGQALAGRPGVAEIHDLHVWEITSGVPAVSAHVMVEPNFDCHAVQRDLQKVLHDDHHIAHTTLQVEHRTPAVLQIEAKPGGSDGADRHR